MKRWRKKVGYDQDVAVVDSPVVLSIKQRIMYLLNLSSTWNEIADDLGMTVARLLYWRGVHNFEDTRTSIADFELDGLVSEISSGNMNLGERIMLGHLTSRNISVTRTRLRESINRIDPDGREGRRQRRCRRVVYNIVRPNHMWLLQLIFFL